jgi:hypothetical protein
MEMPKNQTGAFQILAILIGLLVVVTLVGGSIIYAQRAEVKRLKSENQRLVIDNNTLATNFDRQATANKEDAKRRDAREKKCLEQLGQCEADKVPVYQGCPVLETQKWEDQL